jgi:hypothetical protein
MSMRLISMSMIVAALGCGAAAEGGSGTDTDATSTGVRDTWGSSWGSTTTPWNIDTENPPPSPLTQGGTEGETGDVEESEGEEEDFIGWFGFGAATPGVSYEAEGEAIVFVDGEDLCILIWQASSMPADDCAACEYAFALVVESVEVESDEDCSLLGIDAESLEGMQFGVGWEEETLHTNFGDGWVLSEGGFAEYLEDRGGFEWELPLHESRKRAYSVIVEAVLAR